MNAFEEALSHHRAGKLEEAAASYRRLLDVQPDHADAIYLLGVIANERRDHSQAAEFMERAAALRPDVLHFQLDLGIMLTHLGRLDQAIAALRSAVAIKPDSAQALGQLGLALHRAGDLPAGLSAMRLSHELEPNAPAMLLNLGALLHDLGRYDDAIANYRQAIALMPNYGNAYFNLGAALQAQGKLDDALSAYETALRITPNRPDALNNAAGAFKDQGRVEEALKVYLHLVTIAPNDPLCHSNLVYTKLFDPACDVKAQLEEARRWNERHATPLRSQIRPLTPRDASKRIRVGYVSPDFKQHAVGRFFLPLVEHHDRGAFEVFCYSDVRRPDAITDKTRSAAEHWRDTATLNDDQLADQIRADGIDVLIDLTMHMDRNRLPVFARHPGRVQATYLAYCGTTGLDAIEYRLSDPHLDPLGIDEAIYAEKTVRLPDTYWCYAPPASTPDVNELPLKSRRNVTFGCLNNFCKVTPAVLTTFAKVLARVSGSSLIISACDGSHRQRVWQQFQSLGVRPERVQFVSPMPIEDYFKQYRAIDLALDPFPYTGGTTTCDALWMGVPVVTLAGRSGMSRAGASILTNAGLSELIADSETAYIDLAAKVVADVDRLAGMRSTLRDRVRQSVLSDAPRFARNFESALRQMLESAT